MVNKKQAGKRWERWFATRLKNIFPDIRRNAGIQSQSGGVDLENTNPFNFEVKGGKRYKYRGIRKMIDQVENEGNPNYCNVVLVKPSLENAYAIIPFDDFKRILKRYVRTFE